MKVYGSAVFCAENLENIQGQINSWLRGASKCKDFNVEHTTQSSINVSGRSILNDKTTLTIIYSYTKE